MLLGAGFVGGRADSEKTITRPQHRNPNLGDSESSVASSPGDLGSQEAPCVTEVLCERCRSYSSPGWYHQDLGLQLQYQFQLPPGRNGGGHDRQGRGSVVSMYERIAFICALMFW